MQVEIDAQDPALVVQILGVNESGLESGNGSMTAGRALPWLQPAAGEDTWALWEVTYRDVVILGPGNEYRGTFNLTEHNLSEPDNYALLMGKLIAAANPE